MCDGGALCCNIACLPLACAAAPWTTCGILPPGPWIMQAREGVKLEWNVDKIA